MNQGMRRWRQRCLRGGVNRASDALGPDGGLLANELSTAAQSTPRLRPMPTATIIDSTVYAIRSGAASRRRFRVSARLTRTQDNFCDPRICYHCSSNRRPAVSGAGRSLWRALPRVRHGSTGAQQNQQLRSSYRSGGGHGFLPPGYRPARHGSDRDDYQQGVNARTSYRPYSPIQHYSTRSRRSSFKQVRCQSQARAKYF